MAEPTDARRLRAVGPWGLGVFVLSLLLTGCGTCVTITGPSPAVWDAVERSTRGELQAISDAASPPLRRDTNAGTLTTTVADRDTRDEVSVRITIAPAWTEDAAPHEVCVVVQQLAAERDDVAMRARRRPDIERNIADRALAIVEPAPPDAADPGQ